jgi:hypothetical protein
MVGASLPCSFQYSACLKYSLHEVWVVYTPIRYLCSYVLTFVRYATFHDIDNMAKDIKTKFTPQIIALNDVLN